ncbi:hypothetical protein V1478_002038 [Vespula squamosa]|uniref:Uncharacterized protein n=1 Tax=Vespula squamosa TaxID=30214 RepID=A0ABD2BYU5_VESSQ
MMNRYLEIKENLLEINVSSDTSVVHLPVFGSPMSDMSRSRLSKCSLFSYSKLALLEEYEAPIKKLIKKLRSYAVKSESFASEKRFVFSVYYETPLNIAYLTKESKRSLKYSVEKLMHRNS